MERIRHRRGDRHVKTETDTGTMQPSKPGTSWHLQKLEETRKENILESSGECGLLTLAFDFWSPELRENTFLLL